MNNVSFQIYNIINPKDEKIDEIANYIIKNKIISLPIRLRNKLDLFKQLISQKYQYLSLLNFSDNVYNQFGLDNFISYVIHSDSNYYHHMPAVFKKNPELYNILLEKAINSIYYFDDMLGNNADIYNKINKEKIAKALNAMFYYLGFDLMRNDMELFKIMIANNYKINFNIFSDELLISYGYDKIADYITSNNHIIDVSGIPPKLLNDRNILLKYCSSLNEFELNGVIDNNNLSLENQYYLLANYSVGYVRDELVAGFADYVMNNNISTLPDSAAAYKIFPLLLEKEYRHFFDIYNSFLITNDKIGDDIESEKIINLFFKSDYDGRFNNFFEEIIFSNPRSLDNIPKIGDYIINNHILFIDSWPCTRSIELFNYLYNRGYDELLGLNFNLQLFDSLPVEKLRDFYKKNPQMPLSSLSLEKRMAIMGIDMKDISYDAGKYIILYEQRNNANLEMEPYNNLSVNICNCLKIKSVTDVYSIFSSQLTELERLMNISNHDLIDLFINYQLNPAEYEIAMIDLFREFSSRKKEQIATRNYEYHMRTIKANNSRMDNTEQVKRMKKAKRKDLFKQYVVDVFYNYVNEYEEDRIELLEMIKSLGLDNFDLSEAVLIIKIILGDEVVEKPASYQVFEKQKAFNRLKNNYTKLLNNIVNANSSYRTEIIEYINGNYPYNEICKIIDASSLKILYELRNIFLEAGASLLVDNELISFVGDYQISDQDRKAIHEYDNQMQAINKLRKFLNKKMNEMFPLDAIEIDGIDIDVYGDTNNSEKAYLDPLKIDNIDLILRLYNIRDNYKDSNCVKVFDKLFLDSGIIYGIPFVSSKLSHGLIELATNLPYMIKLYQEKDLSLDNLDMLIKRSASLVYVKPHIAAILGEQIISDIVNNDNFITDTSVSGKQKRVEDGAKYISLAGRNIRSTIPYTRVETDEFIAERYYSDDPEILTTGIKTSACFRLYGNDNDFLLYTMFNKNGIVVRLSDKDGKFVGRVSGFRNGNTIYFNQLRTVYDSSGSPNKNMMDNIAKLRVCFEKYAKDLIEKTKNSAEPIEHILIVKAYGYAGCDYLPVINKPSHYPMSVVTDDYKEFSSDRELKLHERGKGFTTDYHTNLPVLLLATDESKKFQADRYDASPIYDRPRRKPIIYDQAKLDDYVLSAINAMNAKNIYWGDAAKREQLKKNFQLLASTNDIVYAVIGDDFYIVIDNVGNVHELCLPYDKRALEEFKKYKEIILETYDKNHSQSR